MKYFSPGLLDGSVTTAKLADLSVTTAKLADFAVSEVKILNNAVTGIKIKNNTIRVIKLIKSEVSLSGALTTDITVDLALTPECFWPMIHVSDTTKVELTGHSVDSPGADNPRFSLRNKEAGAETYDVDYRNLDQ